ncbi:hypothetical protein KM043_011411 [Ampulex compressa]|nr:hypothetical protein KM043_011411 [Ampulex compressa]
MAVTCGRLDSRREWGKPSADQLMVVASLQTSLDRAVDYISFFQPTDFIYTLCFLLRSILVGIIPEFQEVDARRSQRKRNIKMIPDTESVCESSEAAVKSMDVYRKIRNVPEKEAASVTAWKRYQQLVAMMESKGGKFNRKSMIEAIFRGNDLVYASH